MAISISIDSGIVDVYMGVSVSKQIVRSINEFLIISTHHQSQVVSRSAPRQNQKYILFGVSDFRFIELKDLLYSQENQRGGRNQLLVKKFTNQ